MDPLIDHVVAILAGAILFFWAVLFALHAIIASLFYYLSAKHILDVQDVTVARSFAIALCTGISGAIVPTALASIDHDLILLGYLLWFIVAILFTNGFYRCGYTKAVLLCIIVPILESITMIVLIFSLVIGIDLFRGFE